MSTSESTLRTEWFLLITVALGGTLAPLNSTMIAMALPTVMIDFDVDLGLGGWLVTGYLIVMASVQPIAGKLGDLFGRRRLILGGLIYFGLVSLGASLAFNFWMLLFFRIQQGVAAAITLPNGTALLREVIPEARRAGRFGLVGMTLSMGAAVGLPLGGFLVEYVGWNSIFYFNLFLIAPALILGWRVLPRGDQGRKEEDFDLKGAVMLCVGLVGGVFWMIQAREPGFVFLWCVVGVGLLVLFAIFLRHELQHSGPVVQVRFFKRRSFVAAASAISLSNLTMYTTMLAIPMLATGWGLAIDRTGLVMMSMMATMVVFAPIGGRLADRFGRRWPPVCGALVLVLGVVFLGVNLASGEVSQGLLAVGLGIIGLGTGLAGTGLQTAAVESVGSRDAGVAAGLYSTSRYLGSILGSTLLAGLLGSGGEGGETVFWIVFCAGMGALFVSFFLEDRPGEKVL